MRLLILLNQMKIRIGNKTESGELTRWLKKLYTCASKTKRGRMTLDWVS